MKKDLTRVGKMRVYRSVRPEPVEGYEWIQTMSFETLRQAQGERGECGLE